MRSACCCCLKAWPKRCSPASRRRPASATDTDLARHAHADGAHGVSGTDRYCTECLITGSDIDRAALRAELAALGSSVVVIGNAAKLRLHVHVAAPEQVFRLARRHGLVSAEKADDMLRQERSLQAQNRRVAIVTDSAADLPAAVWDELGIQMVPLRVIFGAQSHLDKVGLRPADFFAELARNPEHPTTSQPSPGDFRRVFELLCSHFEHVLTISLTARLSGTHQAAVAAASRSGKPGSGDRARQPQCIGRARTGGAGCGRSRVQWRGSTGSHRCCHTRQSGIHAPTAQSRTSAHAVRGGRIPQPWRWLGSWLPVTFIIGLDAGRIRMRGIRLRSSDRVAALLKPALRDVPSKSAGSPQPRAPADRPRCRTGARRRAAQAVPGAVPGRGIASAITELGPAVGVHGGPGTLVLAVQVRP